MRTLITQRIWPLIKRTGDEWLSKDGSRLAAATAYYASFSFFPLLLVLFTGLGYLLQFSFEAKQVREQILALVAQNISSATALQLRELLEQVQLNPSLTGPLGVGALCVGVLGIFVQIDSAFDHLWDIPAPEPSGWTDSVKLILHGRFKAFLTLLAMGGIITVAFIGSMLLSAARGLASALPYGDIGFQGVQFVISMALYVLGFWMIYTVMPKVRVHWRDSLIGAVCAAAVWEIGRAVLAFVITGTYYTTAYGIIGSFIAIMTWIYFASTVLYLGAELVRVLCIFREETAGDACELPPTRRPVIARPEEQEAEPTPPVIPHAEDLQEQQHER